MRKKNRIPAILALALALTLPTLAQSAQTPHPAQPEAAKTDTQKPTPPVDPNKTYLLHEEYVAKTAELRGKAIAKQAELETLLATKPDNEAAVKKLVAEIAALRGQLLEQTTLFRIRFAKETGLPIRLTRGMNGLGFHGGQGGMMQGMADKDCMAGKDMMMGKGMGMGMGMMMGKDMTGAPGMGHDMPMAPGMPMPTAPAKADDAAKVPAAQ